MTDSKGPSQRVARFLEIRNSLQRIHAHAREERTGIPARHAQPLTLEEIALLLTMQPSLEAEMEQLTAALTPYESAAILKHLNPYGAYTNIPLPEGVTPIAGHSDAPPADEPVAVPPAAESGKARKETQGDLVEKWLVECEKRAKELGSPFDRWNMPGQKAQFLDLLSRQEPSFKKMKLSTLDRHYLPSRCRWSEGANANPDATPLYERLLPDAYPKRRAVSSQRGET